MSAPTERELAREARRVLRKLLGGAHLELGGDGRYAIASRATEARHAKAKIESQMIQAMRARDWLAERDGALFVTPAGEGWFARQLAGSDPFADQHRTLRTRLVADEQGSEHYVVVNAAESPLAWMHQRRIVDDTQYQAGERLRRDFTLAQLSPRLGVDLSAPMVFGRRAPKPDQMFSDTVLAAKQRFANALRAVGPGLSDILFDVCCILSGLEENERARGWPRASAKVVLKIALDRLAAHYGMTFRAAPARIRAWAAEDDENAPAEQFLRDGGCQDG